jgi:hypothetical protein
MNEGILKAAIINAFNNEFERRCLSLLYDAYASAQSAHCIDIECPEEYISAILLDYAGKSLQTANLHIDIAPEYLEYKNSILKQKKAKKTTPKISLKFGSWINSVTLDYFVETQSIIEIIHPKKKKARLQNPVTISEFHVNYIAKLDSCLSNKYPVRGCIIGYILKGNAQYTVNCLNHYLCDCNRTPEILNKHSIQLKEFDACYVSVHNNRIIQHLMFEFN